MKVERNNYKKSHTGVFDEHMEMMLCGFTWEFSYDVCRLNSSRSTKDGIWALTQNDLKPPHNRLENPIAGKDWLKGFFEKTQGRSTCTVAWATSIAHASSVNEMNAWRRHWLMGQSCLLLSCQ